MRSQGIHDRPRRGAGSLRPFVVADRPIVSIQRGELIFAIDRRIDEFALFELLAYDDE